MNNVIKHEVHSGKIISFDSKRETSRGRVWELTFQGKEKLLPCLVWEEAIVRYEHLLKIDIQVVIHAIRESSGILKILRVHSPESARKTRKMTDEEREAWRLYIRERARHGQVLLHRDWTPDNAWAFERVEYCIRVGDHWEAKIDFVLRVLGSEKVNTAIRERCANPLKNAKKEYDASPYRLVLDELVQEAIGKLNTALPEPSGDERLSASDF